MVTASTISFLCISVFHPNVNFPSFSSIHIAKKLTGARTVQVTDNVGHAGLVAHESRHVDRLGGIILGESLDSAAVRLDTLTGRETQVTVAGSYTVGVHDESTFFVMS